MKYDLALHKIRAFLTHHKPLLIDANNLMPAAVLIPIFNKDGGAHLLLTRRTDTVGHHKGQVSFPGGSYEPQDADLLQTALRETEEEVGIPPRLVTSLGQLDDFPTISHFMISPFIGSIPYPYPQEINPDEVAEILEVPLSLFLTDQYFQQRLYTQKGKTYPVYYYAFERHTIWGVTGHIIHRMIEQIFNFSPSSGPLADKPFYQP